MKKFIIFSFLTFLLALFLAPSVSQAQRPFEEISDVDSLVNQDTVILNLNYTFKKPYYFSVAIQADSISGANAGTCYLQFTNDKTVNTTRWHTAQTLTIDGAGTSSAIWEGIIYARRARLYFISPSGTRRTDIYTYISLKAFQ